MTKQTRLCCLLLAMIALMSGCKIADFELKFKDANVAVPAQLAPLLGTQKPQQPTSDTVVARRL